MSVCPICVQGSRMPKSMFFFQFQTKNSQIDKKKFFFFLFSIFISYNTSYIFTILTITLYIKKKVKFNYWNQSSNGNVIHKDDVKFPNLVKTPLIFPIPWAPTPFPKRDVRALVFGILLPYSTLAVATFRRLKSA